MEWDPLYFLNVIHMKLQSIFGEVCRAIHIFCTLPAYLWSYCGVLLQEFAFETSLCIKLNNKTTFFPFNICSKTAEWKCKHMTLWTPLWKTAATVYKSTCQHNFFTVVFHSVHIQYIWNFAKETFKNPHNEKNLILSTYTIKTWKSPKLCKTFTINVRLHRGVPVTVGGQVQL